MILRKESYYVKNGDLPSTYISYATNIALSIHLYLFSVNIYIVSKLIENI